MKVVAWTTFPEWMSRRLDSRKGSLILAFMEMNCCCSAHPSQWTWITSVSGELQWQLWDISAELHRESNAPAPESLHLPTLWEWLPQYKTILPVLPMFGSIHVCELSVSVSVWLMRDNQRKRVTPGWNLAYGQAGKSGLNGWTLNSHAEAVIGTQKLFRG